MWAVFESNDEKLWARVKQTIRLLLTDIWGKGILKGAKPDEAFFVTCDRTIMTQEDIVNGHLIMEVGLATIMPAEFVIFKIKIDTYVKS